MKTHQKDTIPDTVIKTLHLTDASIDDIAYFCKIGLFPNMAEFCRNAIMNSIYDTWKVLDIRQRLTHILYPPKKPISSD